MIATLCSYLSGESCANGGKFFLWFAGVHARNHIDPGIHDYTKQKQSNYSAVKTH